MSYLKKVEFANFTCNFGDTLNMIDLFDEVVFPSFSEKKYHRSVRGSDYFFIDTQLVKQKDLEGKTYIGIAGKIVKNTKLKRDQIYSPQNGIIEDHEELESAPTSMFVLILNNHRLVFVKEVPGAPGLQAFGATCSKFFREQHTKFIDESFKSNNDNSALKKEPKHITKKDLIKKYPHPSLRVTPLTDSKGLHEFIGKFQKINKLVITLLPTNNEDINNDGFWNDLDDTRDKMGSKKARIDFANNKDGLETQEVLKQSGFATKLANSEIRINGFDKHGGTLKGNNKDFSLTVETEDLQKNVKNAGPSLISTFLDLVHSKSIAVPSPSRTVTQKIQSILGQFLL